MLSKVVVVLLGCCQRVVVVEEEEQVEVVIEGGTMQLSGDRWVGEVCCWWRKGAGSRSQH
jgi:hypothetical protein